MRRIALIATIALSLAACGQAEPPAPAAPTSGEWSELPAAPLSARSASHAFGVGGKLYVFGGNDAPPCPPAADCITPTEAPLRDGASYDPTTGEWTTVAQARVPLGYGSGAVVGDRIYLLIAAYGSSHPTAREAFLSYDVSADEWSELQLPPDTDLLLLAATDETVVAYRSTQEQGVKPDYLYDPAMNAWTKLPGDPLVASFDRTMVWTNEGMVLLGIESVDQPGADQPAIYRAAILSDGGWRRLPDSEVVGWNPMWSWVGGRVININIDRVDGGQTNNFGRSFPTGGILDITEQRWRDLEGVPKQVGGFTGITAFGERAIVAGQGWVFDAQGERWHELTRPPGAPEGDAAAAWVGDRLYVWGGTTFAGGEGRHLDRGWAWRAPW